ncbi:MAG: hypothetical protein WCK35_21405, partial [Chloroflexota bacterium]
KKILYESKRTLVEYYNKYMLPACNLFIDIEYNGMLINYDNLKQLSISVKQKLDEAKKVLLVALGVDLYENFNVDSGKQLGEVLQKKGW